MILDHELDFTTADGQQFTASGYGTKSIDQKAAQDAAVGEPLYCLMKVEEADFNTLTSADIAVVTDTDGAGSGEVSLLTKNFLLATLTTALGVRVVGIVPPSASAKRYLRAKVTINGGAPSQGALKIWLIKASDAVRANYAGTM